MRLTCMITPLRKIIPENSDISYFNKTKIGHSINTLISLFVKKPIEKLTLYDFHLTKLYLSEQYNKKIYPFQIVKSIWNEAPNCNWSLQFAGIFGIQLITREQYIEK